MIALYTSSDTPNSELTHSNSGVQFLVWSATSSEGYSSWKLEVGDRQEGEMENRGEGARAVKERLNRDGIPDGVSIQVTQ